MHQDDLDHNWNCINEQFSFLIQQPEMLLGISENQSPRIQPDDMSSIAALIEMKLQLFRFNEKLEDFAEDLQQFSLDWCCLHASLANPIDSIAYCGDQFPEFGKVHNQTCLIIKQRKEVFEYLTRACSAVVPTDKTNLANFTVALHKEQFAQFVSKLQTEKYYEQQFDEKSNEGLQAVLRVMAGLDYVDFHYKRFWEQSRREETQWNSHLSDKNMQEKDRARAITFKESYQKRATECLIGLKRNRNIQTKLSRKFLELRLKFTLSEQEKQKIRADFERAQQKKNFMDTTMGPSQEQIDLANA